MTERVLNCNARRRPAPEELGLSVLRRRPTEPAVSAACPAPALRRAAAAD